MARLGMRGDSRDGERGQAVIAIIHATKQEPGLDNLLADLAKFGIPSKVYGLDDPWGGFGDKLRTACQAARDFPSEQILFLDAWDIRVIAPVVPSAMPLFGTEKNCWPDAELRESYPPHPSPWRFINSGAYVAEASWLRAMLDPKEIAWVSDDQRFWTKQFLAAQSDMRLDCDCRLFQSCAFSLRGNWGDYGGKLVNLTTMSTPAVLHFNGRTEQWTPDGRTALQRESSLYQDTEENAARLVNEFTQLVNDTDWLSKHRTFAEHGYGCGDRSFHWMWHLLVGEMPQQFKFLEVGVYKGQVLSLVQLLANQWKKAVGITGVTMLSDFSGSKGEFPKYEDRDYLADIKAFHDAFTLNFDPAMLIVGDSTADWVVARTKERAQFDLVYIDAGHEYDYVRADIRNYAAMVKPGGYLVMDDAANDCKQPWGFFQGIEQVSRACRETICGDPQWEHVVTVMHNRVFRKVA